MTPHNLAIVFSPNLMRPKVDNPATIVEEMKLCVKTVETLLLEHMNESLKVSMSLPSSMRVGMGPRFSTTRRRNDSVASSEESGEAPSATETVASILKGDV